VSDSEPEKWEKTKRFYGQYCPECKTFSHVTVHLDSGEPSHHCGACDNQWRISEIENCVACEKPLGGGEAICHSCYSSGSPMDGAAEN